MCLPSIIAKIRLQKPDSSPNPDPPTISSNPMSLRTTPHHGTRGTLLHPLRCSGYRLSRESLVVDNKYHCIYKLLPPKPLSFDLWEMRDRWQDLHHDAALAGQA